MNNKDLIKTGELAKIAHDLRQQNEELVRTISRAKTSNDNTLHIMLTVSSILLNIFLGAYVILMPT